MRWLLLLIAAPLIAATGDITAIRVVGATTAVTDTASACNNATAQACNGSGLEIDVTGLSTGGAYALGIGANYSPAAANIVCTVTSSGYNSSAALGTTTRTVYGTHQFRRVYNAGYTPPYPSDETVVSSTLTLRIALSDVIYSGDTATCNVAAGIYTQGTATNAATGVSVTNNSTLPYSIARVILAWAWPGYSRITGNSLTLRVVGFQRHAKNGKPLAAVKFTCTDAGAAHTATATVTDMTIDGTMPDAVKVQEYVGTLNVTGFTQASLVTCNVAGYPWVGDATSVMDTSDGVNAQPTPNYAPQFYIMDAAGTFGTAAAVVDGSAGNDSTCVATDEGLFNGTSDAATLAPCLTIRKAAIQMRVWIAAHASPARADLAGTIYVKAGSYAFTGSTTAITASSGTNPDMLWTTVTTFPGVARSAVSMTSATSSGTKFTSTSKTKISNLTVRFTGTNEFFSSNLYFWLHGSDLLNTSTASATLSGTSGGVAYWTQNIVGTNGTCAAGVSSTCLSGGFSEFSNSSHAALVRGNVLDNVGNLIRFFTLIGNSYAGATGAAGLSFKTSDDTTTVDQSYIFAYNKLLNMQTTGSGLTTTASVTTSLGGATVGNLMELNGGTSATIAVSFGGDPVTPIPNAMAFHNTFAGNRFLYSYNATGTSPMLHQAWSIRNNVFERWAIKSDTFGGSFSANRVGNWPMQYGVGNSGNIDAADGTSGNAVGGSYTFEAEWPGLYSNMLPIAASLDLQATTETPAVSSSHSVTFLKFVSRAAYDGVSAGAGNGDYHLASGSPANGLVPSGGAVTPYDLDGVARRNDGTGAAGAYEYVSSGSVFRHRVIQ